MDPRVSREGGCRQLRVPVGLCASGCCGFWESWSLHGGEDGRKVPVGCGTLVVWLCSGKSWSPNTVSLPLCTMSSVVCSLWGLCWLLL